MAECIAVAKIPRKSSMNTQRKEDGVICVC